MAVTNAPGYTQGRRYIERGRKEVEREGDRN
jgi:hypothetical protein